MRNRMIVSCLAVLYVATIAPSFAVTEPRKEPSGATAVSQSNPDDVMVVRILFIKGVSTREVVSLLRREVGLRSIAEWTRAQPPSRHDPVDAVVFSGSKEETNKAETVLSSHGFSTERVAPHPPIDVSSSQSLPVESRAFHIRLSSHEVGDVGVLLQLVYGIRPSEIDSRVEDGVLIVRAPAPILDDCAATLAALGLLAD